MFAQLESAQSLLLVVYANSHFIGSATGFVVDTKCGHVLVTNWHVVAGRDPNTDKVLSPTGALPDSIGIWHNQKKMGRWKLVHEGLYDSGGSRRWHEHPVHGRLVDVVALPIKPDEEVVFYPHDIHAGQDIRVTPAEPVSVVGFPFGNTSTGSAGDLLAIWATGFVASDMAPDWNGLPAFLVDCRGRPGQSGSPVLARRPAGYVDHADLHHFDKAGTRFMGVYSGRVNSESDIGIVWKVEALDEIISSMTGGAAE